MFFLWRPTFLIVGLVFLIAGIGMAIFVGAYVAGDYARILGGERAQAVVLQARDGGKPILEFRARDFQPIRLEGRISVSPSPYRVGEIVTVYYDRDNPSDALIDSFIERWFIPLLFGGFGAVFILVGGTMFTLARRSGRKLARLQREGQRIEGRIAAIEMERFTKINGRRPWRVLVDWTDARGVAHRSRSELLRTDPSARFKIGDRVRVIADPNDSAIYWIDLFDQAGSAGLVSPPSGMAGRSGGSFGKASSTPVVRRR